MGVRVWGLSCARRLGGAVLRRVESQRYAMNQDGLIEYIKALVLLGRFDRNDLQNVNRMAQANGLQDVRFTMPEALAAGGGGGAPSMQQGYANAAAARAGSAGGRGGTHKDPLLIAMAEPSFQQQMWKTARTLAMAYLLLLGITTIMEERGLSRGSSTQHSVAQAAESSKTFKDVVGVDEAKAELMEIVDFLR